MLKIIAKLFGTKSAKDIKRVMPLVEETKREGERLKAISHDELRSQTKTVQQDINVALSLLMRSWPGCTNRSMTNRDLTCMPKRPSSSK